MIYTKTGDSGSTSLVGGTRVAKCDDRVEAYGTVDELNAHVGLLAELTLQHDAMTADTLKGIQTDLFTLQTLLATEKEVPFGLPQIGDGHIRHLEQLIDTLQEQLPPLQHFVIPGGSVAGAQCHVARTVCRRAERCMVRLAQHSDVQPQLLQYINRLSDYLFVLSRQLVLGAEGVERLYCPEAQKK